MRSTGTHFLARIFFRAHKEDQPFTELVGWIHNDYGLSELDAYELLSKVAKIHLNEMVDPNYVIVASVEKKFLPPKKK